MNILAIDTASTFCAACIYDTTSDVERGRDVVDIGKGHAEHLMAVIGRALDSAGMGYGDIDSIGVATGPGSFTGIRVGVSAARGLALALKRPAVGVTTLAAVAAASRAQLGDVAVLSAFESARGAIQAAVYDPLGEIVYHPAVIDLEEAVALAIANDAALAGTAAMAIAAGGADGQALGFPGNTADIVVYARLAARNEGSGKPAPLYLRAPDAKPQQGFAVARADR